MKSKISLSIILTFSFFLYSCKTIIVQQPIKKDNGNHYGWYKNPNNPHNPANNGKTTIIIKENKGNDNKIKIKNKKK